MVSAIHLHSSARSDMGQARENNEDYVHLLAHDDFVLAVVADGMGGAAAGEEASRIAVDSIQKGLALNPNALNDIHGMDQEVLTENLIDVIRRANHNIVERAQHFPELKGMGTTVTMAIVRKTQVTVAHVGDSRAYLVNGRDHSITQITSDHSFVQALLSAGHITPEQAEDHPMGNVLYRALGQHDELDVDVYYNRLEVGDRLVLCSDGLTRHVKAKEIAQLSLSTNDPQQASQRLIDLANERGGQDNISVIVVIVDENIERKSSNHDFSEDDETIILRDNRLKFNHNGGGVNDSATPLMRASISSAVLHGRAGGDRTMLPERPAARRGNPFSSSITTQQFMRPEMGGEDIDPYIGRR
jgi:serine/threonine protein phosphatase PrpC